MRAVKITHASADALMNITEYVKNISQKGQTHHENKASDYFSD